MKWDKYVYDNGFQCLPNVQCLMLLVVERIFAYLLELVSFQQHIFYCSEIISLKLSPNNHTYTPKIYVKKKKYARIRLHHKLVFLPRISLKIVALVNPRHTCWCPAASKMRKVTAWCRSSSHSKSRLMCQLYSDSTHLSLNTLSSS